MFAGRFPQRRTVEIVDVPDATLSIDGTGEILFRPELVCLCGSDLPFFDGDFEGHEIAYPLPVGKSLHEMIGTVVETNGDKFSQGQRVLAVPHEQLGFFEQFVLSEDRAIPLDERVHDDEALLAQPFGTVIYALRKLPNMVGKSAVVVGQGPIGQMFNSGLNCMGAKHIVGVDLLESRLEVSKVMGATATVCNATSDPVAATREIVGGEPDLVIEAVGHREQAFNLCVQLSGRGGHMLYFGVPPDTSDGINLKAALHKNLTILTSVHPDFEMDFPLAMQWIAERRVDLTPLLTHRFDLNNIQQAFDTFRDRKDGAQKVLVEFPAYSKVVQ
ncbi:MAG: zinc-binding dehydrogenase [Planctomycetaceae bacterium]